MMKNQRKQSFTRHLGKKNQSAKRIFHSRRNYSLENSKAENISQEKDYESSDEDNFQTIDTTAMTTTPRKNETLDKIKSPEDFLSLLDSGNSELDTTFGVRKLNGQYKIGSEIIDFQDGKIYIKGKPYHETTGLLQLLFRKAPNKTLITESDIKNKPSVHS